LVVTISSERALVVTLNSKKALVISFKWALVPKRH
jgi:hypothetical protein